MNGKDLFYFTGQCLSLDRNPDHIDEIVTTFSTNRLDLEHFLYFCDGHLILPAIYYKFKSYDLLNLFPEELKSHLEMIFQMNKERNTQILHQAYEICDKLKPAGIEPLFLKGTANMLDNLYDDIGERMVGDIDMLVKKEDYLEAITLVRELGYKTVSKLYDQDVMIHKHYPRLIKNDVPADIEIHHLPVNKEYTARFSSELIFRNKKPIGKVDNCFVQSDEHKIIHNFIHSQLCHSAYRFKTVSLRDLNDLYLSSKRVDPFSLLDDIEQNKMADNYFSYSNKALKMGLSVDDSQKNKQSYQEDLTDYFLKFPKIHRKYIVSHKLFDLLFIHYFWRIVKMTYQKSSRDHVINRISDPQWYKTHFNGLKKYF